MVGRDGALCGYFVVPLFADMDTTTTPPLLPVRPSDGLPRPTQRLPLLAYNIMKDAQLRTELAKHGLPTTGCKKAMVDRHQDFVHRVNAELDSAHPRYGYCEPPGSHPHACVMRVDLCRRRCEREKVCVRESERERGRETE